MSASIRVGEMLPDASGRTDEGTPLSISDFEGRSVAVFLAPENSDESERLLISQIQETLDRFLESDCSPVMVSRKSAAVLRRIRVDLHLSFLLISDFDGEIHRRLSGASHGAGGGVWISDDEGRVCSVAAGLEPVSLVETAIRALSRLSG